MYIQLTGDIGTPFNICLVIGMH